MRFIRSFFVAVVAAVVVLVGGVGPVGAQDDTPPPTTPPPPPPPAEVCNSCDTSGSGGVEGNEVFATVSAGSGVTLAGSGGGSGSGGGESCTYWLDGLALDLFGPEAEYSAVNTDEQWAYVAWDCDGDGLADGTSLVRVVTPVEVARVAFDKVKDQLPEPDIVFMLDFALSQEWTPLAVGTGENYFSFEPMSWEPVSASATIGNITSTTTATPVFVEWDLGPLNGSRGHSELRHVTCDGPGVIPFEDPGDVPCRAWFMTSSSGQVDANGVLDRISIYATVYWDVSYTSNAGGGDSDWFRYDVIAERHEVAVAEIQSVIID